MKESPVAGFKVVRTTWNFFNLPDRVGADYKPPFALTAKLNKLTLKVDRPRLSPADIQKLEACTGGTTGQVNRTWYPPQERRETRS